MALWLILAAMTAAAALVALLPLARRRAADHDGGDAAVYRDQIAEIERDKARGLIGAREAEAARAEVARRLFAATEAETAARARGSSEASALRRRRIAAVAALVVTPAVALGFYGALGRPDVSDRPLAARRAAPPDSRNVDELVARAEAELKKNPSDGRGWLVLGPIYLRLGRADEAVAAYANAIRLLGANPDLEANLGEAMMARDDGAISAETRAVFERAANAEPPSVKGAFYLARAAEQDGDLAGAVARIKALLAKAPAGAPYVQGLKGELTRIAAPPAIPMPSDQEAAAAKTPQERMQMVRGMVDRLEERLKDGGEIGDWLRLVQSRAVLGDADSARASLAEARRRFASDPRATARLDALAVGVGLEGQGA